MIAASARRLVRLVRAATLASVSRDAGGWPAASLVTTACDSDGSPILLLSTLADHTRNLAADPRAALLFEAASRRSNPQTGPRVSVAGTIAPADEPRLRRRFLARHPAADLYAGFADFGIFRMQVQRAHYVGGFARAAWLEGARFRIAAEISAAFAAEEEKTLAELNDGYRAALQLLAARLLRRAGTDWVAVGIDPDGCDLRRGATTARLSFAETIPAPAALASAIDRLIREIRVNLG
ncbi:MAG: pyridoxamine 5'-phosphate oxidase family protein [Defluviicoccus sp.]